jgi:hypothetical protein
MCVRLDCRHLKDLAPSHNNCCHPTSTLQYSEGVDLSESQRQTAQDRHPVWCRFTMLARAAFPSFFLTRQLELEDHAFDIC